MGKRKEKNGIVNGETVTQKEQKEFKHIIYDNYTEQLH